MRTRRRNFYERPSEHDGYLEATAHAKRLGSRWFLLLVVVAALGLVAAPVSAQKAKKVSPLCPGCGGGGSPSIVMPAGGLVSTATVSVTIQYEDNVALQTPYIYLNGTSVTSSFSVTGGGTTSETATGSVTLTPGSNTLSSSVCDNTNTCTSASTTYTYDNQNPTVSISPGTSLTSSSSRSVTITWGDNLGLNSGSRVIKLNGTVITSSFNYSGSSTSATSSGTVTLSPGTNTFYAYIQDNSGRHASETVTYTYDNQNPTVSILPVTGDTVPGGQTSMKATITWGDNLGLSASSRVIKVNGTVVTSSFSYSGTSTSATSTGSVSLGVGNTTLYGYIKDNSGRYASETVTYTRLNSYTVAVTPDGATASITAGHSGSVTDTVKNEGNSSATYSISATCTGSGASGTCTPSKNSVTLSAGQSTTVSVSYGTRSGGKSVLVELEASGTDASNDGSTTVTLTYANGADLPAVATVPVTGEMDRSGCLTVALAQAAESNCGDLEIAHPLPVMRSMNKTFAPELLYTASTTQSSPVIVPMDVLLPSGSSVPDSVTAALMHGTTKIVSGSWTGSHWTAGATLRVVPLGSLDSTAIFADSLAVSNFYSGTPHTTKVVDTLITVSRGNSPFGNGWWLAGLEQLKYVGQSEMLWIGGDGSARIYHRVGSTNTWRGENRTRPDSIIYQSPYYVRVVPGGRKVNFNSSGQQVSTVDLNGATTTFSYNGSGDLTQITLPDASGSSQPYYLFGYTSGKLSSVKAYGYGRSLVRTVQVSVSSGNLTSITDPNGTETQFTYTATSVTQEVLSGGAESVFFLNDARQVDSVHDYVSASQYYTTTLRPEESQGVDNSGTYAPAAPAALYTLLNGPRTDVADTTHFYLDDYGEPDSIDDALGHRTHLMRTDMRWPGLVTESKDANGREVTESYDYLGRPETMIDYGVDSAGVYATTSYMWSSACPDFPEKITRPDGDYVAYAYNSSCHTAWQQDALGTPSRVNYLYNSNGQLSWVKPPLSDTVAVTYFSSTGNVASVLRHDSAYVDTTTYALDAWGEDTLVVTPVDPDTTRADRIHYDAMGRDTFRVAEGPEDSIFVRNAYSQAGLLDSVTMWTKPDPTGVGSVTDTYEYDRLGRDTLAVGGGATVHFTYDPAGNLIAGGPRPATRVYDQDNRLIRQTYGSVTDRFAYDDVGNLDSADNEYAQIHRHYDLAGRLTVDSLWIAQFDTTTEQPSEFLTTGSNDHRYAMNYSYDLDSRRVSEKYSLNLAPSSSQDSISYAYNEAGFLTTAHDPMGNAYGFAFDAEGRPTSLVRNVSGGTVRDTVAYDERSLLDYHRVISSSHGQLMDETPTYDLLGRLRGDEGDAFTYDPLGPLTQVLLGGGGEELYTTDALGRRAEREAPTPILDYSYQSGTGVLRDAIIPTSPKNPTPDTTVYSFATGTGEETSQSIDSASYGREQFYYYDGQGRMTEWTLQASGPYTAKEGYWYDALGRRVLEWSWQQSNCTEVDPSSGCHATVTRTVWSGNQIAYEVRSPRTAPNNDGETGAQYGRVGYLYAGQLVALWKGTVVVNPLIDALDVFPAGTCGTELCGDSIDFAAGHLSVFGLDTAALANGPPTWYGSTINEQTDASGLLYRVNRYVDPTTGTFTQPDPLGIAGGLDIYGYVGGDPVNNADPFGLDKHPNWGQVILMLEAELWEEEGLALAGAGGAAAGIAGGAAAGVSTGGVVLVGGVLCLAIAPCQNAMASIRHKITCMLVALYCGSGIGGQSIQAQDPYAHDGPVPGSVGESPPRGDFPENTDTGQGGGSDGGKGGDGGKGKGGNGAGGYG